MRSKLSNWIISISVFFVFGTFFILNVIEIENFEQKLSIHYAKITTNNIINQIILPLKEKYDTNTKDKEEIVKSIKSQLGKLMQNKEILFVCLQSNDETFYLNTCIRLSEKHYKVNDETKSVSKFSEETYKITFHEIDGKSVITVNRSIEIANLKNIYVTVGYDNDYPVEEKSAYITTLGLILLIFSLLFVLFINYQDIFSPKKELITENEEIISIFSKIASNSPNGLIFVDLKKRILIYNKEVEKLTGVNIKSALFNDYFQIFPNDYFNLDDVFQTKQPTGLQKLEIINENKNKSFILYNSYPLIIDKVFIGVLVSVTDTTSIYKNEQMKKFDDLLKTNSYLAKNLTTEFLNKINNIFMAFQTLEGKENITKADVARQSQFVLSCVLEVENILNEFNNLLIPKPVDYTLISINEVIDTVIQSYQKSIKDKNINVQINLRPFLTLYADRKKLIEIFEELLKNSIDAIESNGEIIISGDQDSTKTTVNFTDTGCGIPQTVQDNLYNPYNTTKSKHKGNGLARVFKYISLHGGEITYQTNENLGTTFIITLPNRYDLKGRV